jgi:cytochrome c peroxidase
LWRITAGALSFGLKAASKQARSETGTAPSEAAQPATRETRPIPEPGPLAQPKSLDQVSLPAELTSEAIPPDNPQTPEKIALGKKLFFDGRLSADGTVACSICHDPARAFYRWQAHIDRDQRPRRRTQRTDHSERALQQDAVLGRPGKHA